MTFMIIWFLIGLVTSIIIFYDAYKSGKDILYNDIYYFILFVVSGPVITCILLYCVFEEHGKSILIKGKGK